MITLVPFPRSRCRFSGRSTSQNSTRDRKPGSGSSSTPFIQTMRPSTSRTGQSARLGPRNPQTFQHFLHLARAARVAQPHPVAGPPVAQGGRHPGRRRCGHLASCSRPRIGCQARSGAAARRPAPQSRRESSRCTAALRLFALSREHSPAPPTSRSSRAVRSARKPFGSSSFCPARPVSASDRSASVAAKSSAAPNCSAA